MPAFVIGIGGGSASGKSTIAERLRRRLQPLHVELINQDRYFHESDHLPRHASPDGARIWPDHNQPGSFDFARLRADLQEVRDGCADVVIVEGILVLHDPELRALMDAKLFVDADPDERIVRRVRRNVARGYQLEEICEFYLDSVRYRHREYCEPTRAYADLVIPGGAYDHPQAERLLLHVEAMVRARVTV